MSEKRTFKVSNLIVFAIIAGFVVFVWHSLKHEPELTLEQIVVDNPQVIIEGYEPKISVELPFVAGAVAYNAGLLFVSSERNLYVYTPYGEQIQKIVTGNIIRDICYSDDKVYVLHPESVTIYALSQSESGRQIYPDSIGGWNSSDDKPSYCQLAVTGGKIFITDSGNKLIWRFTGDGAMDLQIFSRSGFVVPGNEFAVTVADDTLYCVNPGFHRIERYTLDGTFIDQFGSPGSKEGSFAGCCNPCSLTVTARGDLFTAEKGIARVSAFGKTGDYRGALLSYNQLGSNSDAPLIDSDENTLAVVHKNIVRLFVSE